MYRLLILVLSMTIAVRLSAKYSDLQNELENFVKDKDARIGVAVIFDGADTVQVNGYRDFPMLSVYKFPQAVALDKLATRCHYDLDDYLVIKADDWHQNTWSPMRDKYGRVDTLLTIGEVLTYSLQQSDNNACDMLYKNLASTTQTDSIIKKMGYKDIHIVNTEDEMHRDVYLCYQNRSTPVEMARLFDDFYRGKQMCNKFFWQYISDVIMYCKTGLNRLAKPLPGDVKLAHKTGTGDRNSQGRIIGVNDVGYVFLPDGKGYAIAVFVADSAYDLATNEQIIADISQLVYSHYVNRF